MIINLKKEDQRKKELQIPTDNEYYQLSKTSHQSIDYFQSGNLTFDFYCKENYIFIL